jgi:hypothetical protein
MSCHSLDCIDEEGEEGLSGEGDVRI